MEDEGELVFLLHSTQCLDIIVWSSEEDLKKRLWLKGFLCRMQCEKHILFLIKFLLLESCSMFDTNEFNAPLRSRREQFFQRLHLHLSLFLLDVVYFASALRFYLKTPSCVCYTMFDYSYWYSTTNYYFLMLWSKFHGCDICWTV